MQHNASPVRLRLIPDELSHDTIELTRLLHQLALEGRLIGISAAMLYKGGRFQTESAGECYRAPLRSAGMVAVLHAKLTRMAEEEEHAGELTRPATG